MGNPEGLPANDRDGAHCLDASRTCPNFNFFIRTENSDLADVNTALDGRAALYQTDLETGKAFNCTVSAGVPFVLSVTAAATNQQGLYMGVLRSIGSTGQNILKTIQDNGLTNVGVSIRTNARGILVSNNSGNTVTVSIVGAYVWGVSIA